MGFGQSNPWCTGGTFPSIHFAGGGQQHMHMPVEPMVLDFDDDDEPLDIRQPTGAGAGAASSNVNGGGGALVIKTHCEVAAIASGSPQDSIAVLVHAKAPAIAEAEAPRAPLDLVTVLDVSGSMEGRKIALLKQAMGFVIDNLGPDDRLSVVSFSSGARRVTRLARMSSDGKARAKAAVESLFACGGTNIAEGLHTAAKVLDDRRQRNAVSSVILLSDGQDNYTMMRSWPFSFGGGGTQGQDNYEALVPPSFKRTGAGDWSAPIHTFGFGNDHAAAAMNVIAETTSGTFSYIENEAVIQDAFALCIGGLLSVVVQDARIAVACVDPGVRIKSVKSGRYQSRVEGDGRAASVRVGELYADEERRFLLFLAVPPATEAKTTLIRATCSYRGVGGGAEVTVAAEDTVLMRPEDAVDAERSAEVERERVRVEAAEDIAAAKAAAERGAYQEAVRILEKRQRAVAQSEAARDGDPMIAALEAELVEMRRRVSDRQMYAHSGRALMLGSCNTHAQQRATSTVTAMHDPPIAKGAFGSSYATPAFGSASSVCGGAPPYAMSASAAAAPSYAMPVIGAAAPSYAGPVFGGAAPQCAGPAFGGAPAYATPAMRTMLSRSRMAREGEASGEQQQQQQQQPPARRSRMEKKQG